jgi:hypothetical protein
MLKHNLHNMIYLNLYAKVKNLLEQSICKIIFFLLLDGLVLLRQKFNSFLQLEFLE